MEISHVEFYVSDVVASTAELVDGYGFRIVGKAGSPTATNHSLAVQQGGISLVLTEGRSDTSHARSYVLSHGDGVADIALRTADAAALFDTAVARGARPIAAPKRGADGLTTATIAAFGDVTHTFVSGDTPGLPGIAAIGGVSSGAGLLHSLDHFAICLEAGQLAETVSFYERVLGFREIFAERIEVGAQAMDSKVVQSASGAVTLTLIEPDTSAAAGQIDEFIKNHDGPGVQHIAFSAHNVVSAVTEMRQRGVEFLRTPGAYYELLATRLELATYEMADLRRLSILVDSDHDGQLFQIFTRSTHPRRTFFFEVIERRGARTFGSGNIKALYTAVEAERSRPREGSP